MTPKQPQARPYPRRCFTCGEKTVERTEETRHVNAKYEGTAYELDAVMPIDRCSRCGAGTLDNDSDEAVNRALRAHLKLLQREEIRRNRVALKLTQQQLADQLGCASESISRWESGLVTQSRLYDRLLRAYFQLPELRAFLEALASNEVKASG